MKAFLKIALLALSLTSLNAAADSSAYIDGMITASSSADQTAVVAFYVAISSPNLKIPINGFPSFYLNRNQTVHLAPKPGYYISVERIWGIFGGRVIDGPTFWSCNTLVGVMADSAKSNIVVNQQPQAGYGNCDGHPNF